MDEPWRSGAERPKAFALRKPWFVFAGEGAHCKFPKVHSPILIATLEMGVSETVLVEYDTRSTRAFIGFGSIFGCSGRVQYKTIQRLYKPAGASIDPCLVLLVPDL